MSIFNVEHTVQEILDKAGIAINGSKPHDITVNNPAFYGRVLAQGSLGLGEAYVDGWWECEHLDQFFDKLLTALKSGAIAVPLMAKVNIGLRYLLSLPVHKGPFAIGKQHYDIGNDLFEAMLGRTMAYSCAYWKHARTLDDAQDAKLDLMCRKLNLQPGMTVLDIGCGWGSFSHFAATHCGVTVHGITVSREQAEYAKKRCAGLPVTIGYNDYRSIDKEYDRVLSIGMFEHVGSKNYRTYMDCVRRYLKANGLSLLHTIGGNNTNHDTEPWIHKYIFTVGQIPSLAQISSAAEKRLVQEHWENFGLYYDTTLMAWHENFMKAWPDLRSTDNRKTPYNERFYRMWRYYLLSCAGSFRARNVQLWQFVYSKDGLRTPYVFEG